MKYLRINTLANKRKYYGRAIQRCQIHKKRNVESHLPESEPSVASEMEAAYAEFDYKAAKVRLDAVAKRIEYKYPSAAESIREGLEETLTLHSLGSKCLKI
jgi:putative transposase